MKSIILFASGNGSNAENIVRQFNGKGQITVRALFCNNPKAGVIARMEHLGVPVHIFDRSTFQSPNTFLQLLGQYHPDLLVLAGFLWLIPEYLVTAYSGKIINIHPALLPKFGGKGMYGHHVHKAVLAAGEKEHGITVHFVNSKYDEGQPIVQAKFDIIPGDDLQRIQERIAKLEMLYFPEAIKRVLGVQG